MQLIPGAIIGGKYKLERPLASGGMGSVWVARHTDLDVEVALKFIGDAHVASPTLRTRFEREAKASAKISSSHVVHVLDYGLDGDTPFFAMELLQGEDLGARLKREGRIAPDALARLLFQIAKGLRRAHEAGFVHRDLKPSNIFLARIDDGEIVKILDFGVAKETSQPVGESTKTGEIMGSPHYMSPEQICESKSIDARSDLWSLAVILFRALTGELPFPGEACGVVLARILTATIPMPSDMVSDLPPSLDHFFRRAFQREVDLRFQSAREMAEAFAEAVSAKTPPSWSIARTGPISTSRPSMPTIKCAVSSTLPVALDSTLRSPEPGEGSARTMLLTPATTVSPLTPVTPLTPSAWGSAAPADAGGTLIVTLTDIHGERPKPRRPLVVWGLGASAVAGAVAGWMLLASVFGGPSPHEAAGGPAYTMAGVVAAPAAQPTSGPSSGEAPGKLVAPAELEAAMPAAAPDVITTPASGTSPASGAPNVAPLSSSPAAPASSAAPPRVNRPPSPIRKGPRLGF